jgi:hypothetical protein
MNLSLLARWRLVTEGDEMWKNLIVATRLDLVGTGCMASTWWGDLCKLDKEVGWFSSLAVKKLESGNTTRFWKDVWVGNQPLQQRFPRLYGISTQQE